MTKIVFEDDEAWREHVTEWQERVMEAAWSANDHAARLVDAYANHYPDDIFVPGTGSSDSIAAEAIRRAVKVIARDIRAAKDDEPWVGPGEIRHTTENHFDPEAGDPSLCRWEPRTDV